MDWFRMYNEIVYDPKVIRLSDKEHRAWVNMLAIASMNGGVLPSAEDIALHLRVSTERASSLVSALLNRGFFDRTDHGIEPHNWKTRQYVSDCSTPRVRKHRETFPKRARNVSETPSEQNRSETDQKQTQNGFVVLPNPPREVPSAEATSDRFEEFWKRYPHKVHQQLALQVWISLVTAENEAAVFACLERWERSDQWARGIYAAPANWLRDRARDGWTDAPAPSKTQQSSNDPLARFREMDRQEGIA